MRNGIEGYRLGPIQFECFKAESTNFLYQFYSLFPLAYLVVCTSLSIPISTCGTLLDVRSIRIGTRRNLLTLASCLGANILHRPLSTILTDVGSTASAKPYSPLASGFSMNGLHYHYSFCPCFYHRFDTLKILFTHRAAQPGVGHRLFSRRRSA